MENNLHEKKDLNTLLEELKAEAFSYADKKFRYYKLEAFEKIGVVASLIGFGVLILVIAMGLMFFGLFGLAFFLGELLNSLAAGFGILFGFLLLCLLLAVFNEKRIRRFLLNKVILIIRKIDSDEGL